MQIGEHVRDNNLKNIQLPLLVEEKDRTGYSKELYARVLPRACTVDILAGGIEHKHLVNIAEGIINIQEDTRIRILLLVTQATNELFADKTKMGDELKINQIDKISSISEEIKIPSSAALSKHKHSGLVSKKWKPGY